MIHGLDRDPRVDKGVSWLPLFHDMGLIGFVVGPLFTNVPCVLLPAASFARRPRLWLDKIHQHRGTITYAPNFAYALVAKRLKGKDVQDLDLSSLRVSGCGAEPIQASVLREFAATLAPARFDPRAFLPSYGMAEATLAITFTPLAAGPADRHGRCPDACCRKGRALRLRPAKDSPRPARSSIVAPFSPATSSRSSTPPGHASASGTWGRSSRAVRASPRATSGTPSSRRRPSRPLAADAPGEAPWLHTGDLGYMAGGRLFVCGRVKDVIIVRGRNYYPSDIEWAVTEASGAASVRRGNVVAFGVFVDALGRASAGGASEEQLVVCCEGHSTEVEAIRETATAVLASRFGLVGPRGRGRAARVAASHLEREAQAEGDPPEVPRRFPPARTGRANGPEPGPASRRKRPGIHRMSNVLSQPVAQERHTAA